MVFSRRAFYKYSRPLMAGGACIPAAGIMLLLSGTATAQTDLCAKAAALFQSHHWADAAQAYAECETSFPSNVDVHLYRGKALVNMGDFAAAAKELHSYLAANPQSDDGLYLLGYVHFRQDQPRESLETFARANKIRPPAAGDLKIAALDYVLLNDYVSAARYLERSLVMDPADNEALYHLGRVRYQQNRFDLAIAAFEALLKREPDNVKAENNLGLCLEATGKSAAAIASYHKAIDIDQKAEAHTEQPYLNLGKLLNTLNRETEAMPVLAEAVRISPNSASTHYELGRAEFALNRLEEARAQLELSATLDPQNSSPHYLLGRVLSRMGKSEEAAAQFKLTQTLMQKKDAHSGGGMASRP
jgi:tetratricopeptide (TPR) repeat protein